MTNAASDRSAGRQNPPAIVLAAFGTTETQALGAILNISSRVQAAFPKGEVHLAFTSRIIRRIWAQRAADQDYRLAHPEVPSEVYEVKSPLATLALLAEDGPRPLAVQSLHVTCGAEFRELESVVEQLAGLKTATAARHPFPGLTLGVPALGDGGEKYLARAARGLKSLIEAADQAGAALVLMGHGNERLHQAVYSDLEKRLRVQYNRPDIFIGLVEGNPGLEDLLTDMDRLPESPKTVLLAPLMVVAGDHAKNDLAGDEPDSWASVFRARGLDVHTRLQGLGSDDDWADIYIEHLRKLCPAAQ